MNVEKDFMKGKWLGVLVGVAVSTFGAVRATHAADTSGSCKTTATLQWTLLPPPPAWRLIGVGCAGVCPPQGIHSGTCVEYLFAGSGTPTPAFTCACKYEWTDELGHHLVWSYSAQVCDGQYRRDSLNGNALLPLSWMSQGPCSVQGEECKINPNLPANPTDGQTVANEGCVCK